MERREEILYRRIRLTFRSSYAEYSVHREARHFKIVNCCPICKYKRIVNSGDFPDIIQVYNFVHLYLIHLRFFYFFKKIYPITASNRASVMEYGQPIQMVM